MIRVYILNSSRKGNTMYIFISHSSKNSSTAEDICDLIENNGHECFLAPRDIRSGHEYAEEIIDGIDRSDIMLLILSEESNTSPHVIREIERAVSKKIPVIVYKLEDVELSKSMEYFLMTHQWVSAKPNIDHSEVLRCINELASGETAPKQSQPASAKPVKKEKPRRSKAPLIIAIIAIAIVMIIAIVCVAAIEIFGHAIDTLASNGVFNEATEETSDSVSDEAEMLLGETIVFGRYNEEPIKWRVIKISDDNTKAVVISDRILTMKCYDAAEGGKYNSNDGKSYWNVPSEELDAELDVLLRGSNSWESSNIRTWLNSDKENVTYIGQSPNTQAMSEQTNGYNTEAGFLNGFTDKELSAIIPTEITTNGVTTKDRVYLLSSEELIWLENADVSRYAVPTEKAKELDTSKWYELQINEQGVNDHYWWLRDGDGTTASGVNTVSFSYAGGNVISQPAGLEGYGIRPVMTLDITSEEIILKYLAQEIYNEIIQP